MKRLLLLSLLIAQCDIKKMEQAQKERDSQEFSNILYFRDDRTDLCFAGRDLGRQAAVLTNVPCTAKLEQYLGEEDDKSASIKR